MQTLNQHISLFSSFATNHHQLSSFGFGDFFESTEPYNAEEVTYARMWVDLVNTTITDNALIRSYRIAFMDRVNPDERNENDVLSDMEQVAMDLLSAMTKASIGKQDIVRSATIEPFTEATTDVLSGVFLNMQMVQSFTYDYCSVPISGAPTGYGECLPVRIFQDGVVIATVASGGSYIITGGDCDVAVVRNSNSSYDVTVASGGTLVLPDSEFDVYLDGTLIGTVTPVTLDPNSTINITW